MDYFPWKFMLKWKHKQGSNQYLSVDALNIFYTMNIFLNIEKDGKNLKGKLIIVH